MSVVAINTSKQETNFLKVLRKNYCQFNSFYPAKLFVRKKSETEAYAITKVAYYSHSWTKRSINECTSGEKIQTDTEKGCGN